MTTSRIPIPANSAPPTGVSRRAARRLMTAGGATVGLGSSLVAAPPKDDGPTEAERADRGFVMAAGMTAAEAECWRLAARLAGSFFDLPESHPMDDQEVAHAIHVIQNKLLSRPTYRADLERAKAARPDREP